MGETLRSIGDLEEAALLTGSSALAEVGRRYSIAITDEVAALIQRDNPTDPIAKQFLPDSRELDSLPEERTDPIGDEAHSPVKGIVHRYPDRVLLKPVHVCPVYCRFCFRRETVGPGGETLSAAEISVAIEYIRTHPAIWEVILTGGDPLMLSPRRIREVVVALDRIEHVKVVRWHSRVPIVDPSRVTQALASSLASGGRAVWMAVHCNHPRELTKAAAAALARLAASGVILVSQTVLLKDVNDDPQILEQLMRRFVELGVRPYYLHQLDLAPGTEHFRVDIGRGQSIMRSLRGRLSGIAQPLYVLDIPGGHGKVPIGPAYLEDSLSGGVTVTDPNSNEHAYSPKSNKA